MSTTLLTSENKSTAEKHKPQAVLRNNSLKQIVPIVTLCNTIVQYHNQNLAFDTICLVLLILCMCMCVHACMCVDMFLCHVLTCINSCVYHHGQNIEQFYQQDPLCCCFIATPTP